MRHLRIGLTIGTKFIDYPLEIRMGIQNTLEEQGHTFVSVCDLTPHGNVQHGLDYYRMAFQLAARMKLDAIIVPIGCVTAHLNVPFDQALTLLNSLDPRNTIVLEHEVEGFRSIIKDGKPGMRECMRHLIETCGFKKIAFVSGPKESRGGRERAGIYYEEMAAHGLTVTPEMFSYGSFSGDCAPEIEKVLDDNPGLEAIACAADLIAYTAYEVCRTRGLVVGKDIAITGFDDHDRSAHIDPPLSTVHMTGYDLGCIGAREAIRLAEGLPQASRVLSSTFVARSSCGEQDHVDVNYLASFMGDFALHPDRIIATLVDATLVMAGPSVRADFTRRIEAIIRQSTDSFYAYRESHDDNIHLFATSDIDALFKQGYRDNLSLEGFHAASFTLFEGLLSIVRLEERAWVIHELARLHLKVTRLLTYQNQQELIERGFIEWTTFHLIDDALVCETDVHEAYRLIFSELDRMGIVEADIFLLSEAVKFIGVNNVAFSDRLTYIGSLSKGDITIFDTNETVTVQEILDIAVRRYETTSVTVGSLAAGSEVVGLCVIDGGNLDASVQLMAFLNLGFALNHLMLASESREMIGLLNKHSLLLEEQSQHDELTGLLNRRGFSNRIEGLMADHIGEQACIVYMDLDGLKFINDTYGHDVGDEAIRTTANILSAEIPSQDLVARLGGDEFVAFLSSSSPEFIDTITSAITRDMDEVNEHGGNLYTLSISHGESFFTIDEAAIKNYSAYLSDADEHLYAMKRVRKQSRRYGS